MEFYPFGLKDKSTETSKEILGGKGAGLVWMHQNGVNVPPGFIIPTTVWAEYDKHPKTTMKVIQSHIQGYMQMLQKYFGYMPLVSVRSGARVSCPGMMDTILNVGLDFETSPFWKEKLGDQCFVNSCHRLVTMYGSVVKGINRQSLEKVDLQQAFKVYEEETKDTFPSTKEQLLNSIEAVFKSWDNERNLIYRKQNNIPREWGTAVTIQSMVFGNLNENSGTGVLFTRNPDTGENNITGEFAVNAQGEDIVAGITTPNPLHEFPFSFGVPLQIELHETVKKLEKLKKDVQDVEFTIQDGKLFFLQTRNAKRSARAAIKVAVDMEKEAILSKVEAVKQVTVKQFDMAQLASIPVSFKKEPVFIGIAACSGVVSGKPVFTSKDAINCKESCILVTEETTPDDIGGMLASKGVITMTGGLTSHAAVVARGSDVPCITGVGQSLDVFKECDMISMDGSTGKIWLEKIPIEMGEKNGIIKDFSKMVVDIFGAVPIIYDMPVDQMESALLVVGSRMVNPEETAYFIQKASVKVNRLYVDLTVMDGPEAAFISICKDFNPAQKVIEFLEAFEYSSLQERLVVLGEVKTYFKQVGLPNDLRSLIMADHEVIIGDISSDPAFAKVLVWKVQEGLKIISIGEVVPNMKSMISVEKALQLVQGLV